MPKPTYYAKKLSQELNKNGIKTILEYSDGHKSVDIFIKEVNLIIEIDGSHHYNDPIQAFSDLVRTRYSLIDERITIRIPNILVWDKVKEVADIIKDIVYDMKIKGEPYTKKQRKISDYIKSLWEFPHSLLWKPQVI